MTLFLLVSFRCTLSFKLLLTWRSMLFSKGKLLSEEELFLFRTYILLYVQLCLYYLPDQVNQYPEDVLIEHNQYINSM